MHVESETLGKHKLRLEKFSSQGHGGDISFAYNLPLYETAYQGYGSNELLDNRKVTVDDEDYTVGTVDSDNYLLVQPDSGYTYKMKKNSTVFMVVGGNQTASDVTKVSPFPTLDPIYGAAFPLYDFNEELVSNSY